MSSALRAALVLALAIVAGCYKKTVEITVNDPGRVGVSTLRPEGLVPVIAADGVDRSAPLALLPTGERPTVSREGRQIAVAWSGVSLPLSLVDPVGVLPPQTPGRGIAMRAGWLYSKYELTPKRILPEGSPAEFSFPIVVTTPLANVVEAREVHEPRRWPAYVFLPVGGAFTFIGASLLVISENSREELDVTGATYLGVGVPLLVYGLVNALTPTDYVPLDLSTGGGP
jgi:hypothetical protein